MLLLTIPVSQMKDNRVLSTDPFVYAQKLSPMMEYKDFETAECSAP